MTAFPPGAGKAIESVPRGRDQCSGSRPAECCARTDASGEPTRPVRGAQEVVIGEAESHGS
jgi:hypothetical protein